MKKLTRTGFTLIELLIVIVIIAVLAVVTWLMLNPLEFRKSARDSTRLSDLNQLNSAISLAVQEASSTPVQTLCNSGSTPCHGSSHTESRSSDGSGWVKVNLSSSGKSASFATLPVDPTNNSTYHYTYCSDGSAWELDAALEYSKNIDKMSADGGNEQDKYEVGSSLTVIGSGGSCAF